VFEQIRFDNLTSAVKQVLRGRRRVETDRFVALGSHYLFESQFTTPGIQGAHEKGGVEGEVGRYRALVLSLLLFSGLSMAAWGHHMLQTGQIVTGLFALTSTLLILPAGMDYFAMAATLYGGRIRLTVPMLFALGFALQFLIGGVTGIWLASPTLDSHVHDGYFVVAHFHYTLFAGSLFGAFAAIYYWWPKVFGWTLREGVGKVHFWLLVVAANVTFFPMFLLGQEGMVRRIADYPAGLGWELYSRIETASALLIAIALLVFAWNVVSSNRRRAPAGDDPWLDQTLEWAISSPPPRHYDGPFSPLRGAEISRAYDSTLALSSEIPAGLLMRQTHHWAALVFVVAITLHTLRIFFTGAFRSPRMLNHYTGVVLLTLALLLGFTGYSLPDDLLSGMGLAIGYAAALSIPVVGGDLGSLVWGGEYPGADVFESRLYATHIFILPALTAGLIAAQLALVIRQKHTQFPGGGRTETNVVGAPLWAGQALRSGGLFFATAAVLFLLGGLVQINPVWHWGPYKPHLAFNGAQPDWYLGWLIGALRLTPNWEPTIGGYTLAGNPFFGGLLYPGIVFGLLFFWPNVERAVTKDRGRHHLLDRPRDAPWRTAIGAAGLTNAVIVFVAGASDRALVEFGFDYVAQVRVFQVLIFAGPVLAYVLTKRICEEFRSRETHPLAPRSGHFVRRLYDGSFIAVPSPAVEEDGGRRADVAPRRTHGVRQAG